MDHAAVAVQQNQWRSLATLQVMKADPVHVDEAPDRGIVLLGPPCKLVVGYRCGCQNACGGKPDPPRSGSLTGTGTFAVCTGLRKGRSVPPVPVRCGPGCARIVA
ncbi:hypothetical protein GCM10017322_40330 [Paracoccus aerius]|nr:hypothetical protein GCM10017322_40330 [Paracoccus aerius]